MEYHLKPPGRTCAATGQPLVAGSVCYSVLVERDGELERLDFSEEGWQGPPEGTVGQWKTLVPQPTEAKARPLDPEALFRYFEQLTEEASPATEKLRYVLALLLLQKRRLRLDGSRQDGAQDFLLVSGTHGEGNYEVRDCQLSDEEIRQLQSDLNAHLAAEWS